MSAENNTMKLFFYAPQPKSLVLRAFLIKRKERKLQYQWYHNFRSYLVQVARLELAASCSQSRRATNCATPGLQVYYTQHIWKKQSQFENDSIMRKNCRYCLIKGMLVA